MAPAMEVSHKVLVDMDVETALGHLVVGATTLLVASEATALEDTNSKHYLFFTIMILSDHASVLVKKNLIGVDCWRVVRGQINLGGNLFLFLFFLGPNRMGACLRLKIRGKFLGCFISFLPFISFGFPHLP